MSREPATSDSWKSQFVQLVDDRYPDLIRFARSQLGPAGLSSWAEDVTQDAIGQAFQYMRERPDLHPDHQIRTLYWIIKTRAVDTVRYLSLRPLPLDPHVLDAEPAAASDLERQYAARETLTEVLAMVDRMPPRTREIFQHYMSGLNSREIANKYGINRKTVENLISKARRQLRDAIDATNYRDTLSDP